MRATTSVRRLADPVLGAFVLGAVCEAFLLAGFADHAWETAAPWQDDPFHTWVSFAVFALPALFAVSALRALGGWLPWGRTESAGRRRDLAKAGLVVAAFCAVTAGVCWLAVAVGAERARWDSTTTWWLISLVVLTLPLPVVARAGRWALDNGRPGAGRGADQVGAWVGDVLPAPAAAWVRRHDRPVFLVASLVAAVGIVVPLAYGERWTDPLLIGWALVVEVGCYYAFCVLTNVVLGFVDRPQRGDRVERATVLAGVVVVVAVAFHDQIAEVGLAPLGSAGGLAEVTLGPGALAFACALAAGRIRPATPARPAR
jgi:hypothetical protein